MRRITDEERRRRLALRHRLVPSARVDDVADVADELVALHSSDPVSVYLATCARLRTPSIERVEQALYEIRSVMRIHAMRRTLWVMTPTVAQVANAAVTRRIARAERARTARFFDRDVQWLTDAIERVVAVVRSAAGPMTTKEIGAALPDLVETLVVNAGKSYEGTISAHTRVVLHAAFEGRIIRTRPLGTWIGSQYAWVATERWIDVDWSMPDEETGIAELVRRWLDRFGPGTLDDIVWWTGATKGRVRRALGALDAEFVELDDGSDGYALPDDDVDPDDPGPWVALLPGLDPTAMGWKRRAWYLPPDVAARVTDRSGNIGPTVWVDGRVVGGWTQRPDGAIAHDAEIASPSIGRLLDDEIERVRSVVGDTRFSVRFASPHQRAPLA